MNTRQRRVILLGFVVILLMGLFPPWLDVSVDSLEHPPWLIMNHGELPPEYAGSFGYVTFERYAGHKRLFLPRKRDAGGGGGFPVENDGAGAPDSYSYSNYLPRRIDTSLLLVQWFLVSSVTGIIVMYLGDRPQKPADKPGK